MYKNSIHFFDRAAQVQTNEVKWRLMVTSYYQRMGDLFKDIKLYIEIHKENPNNVKCT